MKIVLAGSPKISCPTFEEIIKHFNVVAIVTQSDKPKGRGLKMQETEVALLAKKYNIKVFKPEKIGQIYDDLKKLNYDLFLTFAFGQYVPENILKLGSFPPLNIHGSLLPKYRGAAPIHYAILNNDKEVGITLIEMTKQMDAGKMYFFAKKTIDEKTTTGEAFEIISDISKKNIVSWINLIQENKVTPIDQPKSFSLSPKISKNFGWLKEEMTVYQIERLILGLNPFPGAFFYENNVRVKVFGFCNHFKKNAIIFNAKDRIIYFDDFQYENKKRTKV